MYDWYKSLAREYSSNVAVKSIGKTIAGRDILAVVIGSDTNQPTVYFQCLLHPSNIHYYNNIIMMMIFH